ncbi:MAG: Y-family DNA polymerase [Magnetococcales bacterium]|nr:Y-family DNA polymerase [Magnetococcales bacterium]
MKPPQNLALVDCNNFYVSCERLFNPRLHNRPVIVLSNNDGCAVSRSNEAKALGVPMGAPLHKIQGLIKQHQIQVLSSNYALYADLSSRVMRTLESHGLPMEIYSIDEAFIGLGSVDLTDPTERCRTLQQTVFRHTGIPTSIGIGPTKTLAKLANRTAKKSPRTGGVLSLTTPTYRHKALEMTAVGDIWGIGSKGAAKLNHLGIHTAAQLRDTDLGQIARRLNIVIARTAQELRGIPALEWESLAKPSQSITSSRSFGKRITTLPPLREALASYTARAALKLRRQALLANVISVFLGTSRFVAITKQYHHTASAPLPESINDTGQLTQHALKLLESIYRPGFDYNRAGIILLDLIPIQQYQPGLFSDQAGRRKKIRLMQVMDQLNQKMGANTLRFGAEGIHQEWRMRRQMKSPAYTTNWEEIPRVRAV